ncbi:hypothetical protein HZI73_00925 [Vallitalea pronyensis]|uniref:Pyridoxamine 5'-phosphate oxidase N-terminal domain-containing protein n=1 Tax=Vallitalea pronyensis TaxID=1348613 RepID=A0A8J8MFZ7_9FIRM|nr:hypothetical protein [Vallitalea pronyensis]QUI20945.1 hypothetical protein HZI73_00925 [Vallitalea pronyensis]
MNIPKNAIQLLNDPEASKVLTTVSSDGVPHSIVVGSMMAPSDNLLCAAEVLMKTTAKNLESCENVAVLAVKGAESYLVNGTVKERQTQGELFNQVSEQLKGMGLTAQAVWTFDPTEVYNQSAGPDAGKKIS